MKSRDALSGVPRIILFVILFVVAMIMSAFPVDSCDLESASEDAFGRVELSLSPSFKEENKLAVSILAHSGEGFCGLLLRLKYNDDCFSFVGLTVGDAVIDGAHVSYSEREGEIRILFDGTENTNGGEIASIDFRHAEGHTQCTKTAFEVVADEGGAFRLENREPIALDVLGCSVICDLKDGIAERCDVLLTRVRPMHDEICALVLSVRAEGVFSGVEVVVTELYGGSSERYILSGSSLEGVVCFDREILISENKKYAVAIRSIFWGRTGLEYGDETVCLLQGDRKTVFD